MTRIGRWRPNPLKLFLLALFVVAMGVALYRMFTGLGAVTNLSDTTPWGIWKVWDVIIFVPLGAAGFTMAFIRYFLKAQNYEQIMRRSVLWAAIAYLSVGIRLAFDIGVPWRLPNPIIFGGNWHSPLLEVAWCMVLYILVLFFENAPRMMERSGKPWISQLEHLLHSVMPFFVLAGVLLSVAHQSSLGTLFMAFGQRMDALWYHPWLNYIFLLTAIATGLSVAIVIEGLSHRYYKTPFETKLLSRLSVAVAVALAATLVWRIYALIALGSLSQIFLARSATYWWWAEILVGYVVPLMILSGGTLRSRRVPLLLASGSTILGMMLFRLNVAFTAMNEAMGSVYFPSLTELLFSIGGTAGTILIFTFVVESLPSYLEKGEPINHGELAHTSD